MSGVVGAAVPVFSSLGCPARRNVALVLPLHSSPSPISSDSLSLRACRFESRNRRRIAEAQATSFSSDSDNEELDIHAEPEGSQFAGRRNATWKSAGQDSSSKARVSQASHDEGYRSWIPPNQQNRGAKQIRGVKPFDVHKARSFISRQSVHGSRNHDRDNDIAYNKGRDFLPFKEQQHHGSSVAKKHPRVPLPTKNQQLRMHNKISVYEGITQPSISGLSLNNRADASSWGVEDADVAPNFNRRALNLYEDSRYRLKHSQLATEHGIKHNAYRGAKFMSKLENVLSNLKKKDDLLSAMNQAAPRDENTPTHAGVLRSLRSNERTSAKSVETDSGRDANIIIARDDRRGFPVVNDGKGVHSEPEEARALLKGKARVDNEAAVTSLNLFSSSPSVPWEADRRYASTSKPRLPFRRVDASTSARRSFTSVGSRSSPSRPSVNSRNLNYSKIDSPAATGVVDLSKSFKGEEQLESWFENKVGIELNDDKLTTQIASQKGIPKVEEQAQSVNFDWSELDLEGNGDIALSMHSKTEEIDTKANGPTKSNLSAPSHHSIFDWDDSESEVDEDNSFSFDSDVENDVPSSVDSDAEDDLPSSNDSDAEAATPEFDSSEGSLYNKNLILSSSMTNTHTTSAVSLMDRVSGASEIGTGSNHSNFASWHKFPHPDFPFEFQFSYSETPKAPILGYRETPYSPFGPSTLGRPWTGGPPPNPSKKKQRVFDSFKPPPKDMKGVKPVQDPGPFPEGQGPKAAKSREGFMGEPLTKEEIIYLVQKCERESRQLNLGRDGLTHNMLDLIHCHWKRRRVCRIKCKGVPTVDMDNVKFHIEDKTGGKIIYQTGGVLYLFRGRNYNYKDRPQIPLMLWKPVTPLYPKLIQPAPEGLTIEEARRLRKLGGKVQPICKLGKNGVYLDLVKDVRAAFKVDELVRIDCRGLNSRDYKKIGAKLKDLVPCILVAFDKEHILMWKGKQDLSVENGNLSGAANYEPHLVGERSSVTDEGNDQRMCKEKISLDEASYSDEGSEGETQEKMHQSYFNPESGSVLDYASHEVLAHSNDAEATALPQIAKKHVQFQQANVDETFLSSRMDEGHALTHTTETNRARNYQSLQEEKIEVSVKGVNVSLHELSNLENISSVGDEIHLGSADNLSERHATTDRKLQQETESEGIDSASEKMSKCMNSKLVEDGHEDSVSMQAAAPKESFMHEVEDGLASQNEGVENQTDCVMRLDALWDHAFSSGMAVELSHEGMDADVIVRKAAQLAQFAPLGPTYTIKLMYKLRIKRDRDRPDDTLHIRFGEGKPQKMPKKAVKRKAQLPTLDVPAMGGLPVDELARLLVPKETP